MNERLRCSLVCVKGCHLSLQMGRGEGGGGSKTSQLSTSLLK